MNDSYDAAKLVLLYCRCEVQREVNAMRNLHQWPLFKLVDKEYDLTYFTLPHNHFRSQMI